MSAWLAQLELADSPWLIFSLSLLFALIMGRATPTLLRVVVFRFLPHSTIYSRVLQPNRYTVSQSATLLLLNLSLVWLETDYPSVRRFIAPFLDLATIASVAWTISGLLRQIIRVYGIEVIRRLGLNVDELILVLEATLNIIIATFALLTYAQARQFNLVGLVASLGIGGLALAFAAQKILEQLLSTLVLYLDRPFSTGEYIRLANGQLGRVESIGVRSTKIRATAKNTLLIVPNSNLISMEIENVSRAKKLMVMLYLDFDRELNTQETALVREIIYESASTVFGIDPNSTTITYLPQADHTRARITFFILGSSEGSLALRKRLLELANETVGQKLRQLNIRFSMEDPTVYVESPITI